MSLFHLSTVFLGSINIFFSFAQVISLFGFCNYKNVPDWQIDGQDDCNIAPKTVKEYSNIYLCKTTLDKSLIFWSCQWTLYTVDNTIL